MEHILNAYYENNAKKLHKVVDKILIKFGGITYKDMDDFYSLANEVFVDVLKRYDDTQSFDGFLYSCLLKKIKTEITRRNRIKRMADRMSVSLDTPIDDNDNSTIGDFITDSFDFEKEIFKKREDIYSRKMIKYLNRLSKTQKEILMMTIAGYTTKEIQEILNITDKEYSDCNSAIHSYRNVSVLF